MAIDAFIKFTGTQNKITGESQDKNNNGSAGWSVLQSVEFTSEHIANIGTASGGGGAGKLDFKDFKITKQVDNASPQLFLALCSGDHYDQVTIQMRKAVGGKVASATPYLQYDFALVFVTSIATSLSSSDEAPTESITFAYGSTMITYYTQDATGKMSNSPNVAAWSRITNEANLEAVSGKILTAGK